MGSFGIGTTLQPIVGEISKPMQSPSWSQGTDYAWKGRPVAAHKFLNNKKRTCFFNFWTRFKRGNQTKSKKENLKVDCRCGFLFPPFSTHFNS